MTTSVYFLILFFVPLPHHYPPLSTSLSLHKDKPIYAPSLARLASEPHNRHIYNQGRQRIAPASGGHHNSQKKSPEDVEAGEVGDGCQVDGIVLKNLLEGARTGKVRQP